MPPITPTVGRIVYVFSTRWSGPRAGIITGVNENGTIDVNCWVRAGEPTPMRSELAALTINPPNTGAPVGADFWCEWMPYQMGQAAKTDDLSGRTQQALLILAKAIKQGGSETIENEVRNCLDGASAG